jgi:eukaryotic-like serine/threonine-protein kinase
VAASIGAYEIVLALKEGGMGEVLLARWRGPGGIERLVAIKTIRAELAAAGPVRAMFLDEAGILSRLAHPAVATVHDFGEDGRTLFLVMEYVAGIAFRELIDRRPPPGIAARAIAEACRGLHAAHEVRDLSGAMLGVVHRDISPENLMLGFDGHVKVIDFGIALIKGRHAPVTELGTIKGKPPYMSPEQVKNEPIDRQSDVFSLSVVLHELLTGRALFDGESIYAVARAVEHAEIAPPSTIAGPLPAGLDAAVMRGLARDRAQRTPTAAALAEELEAVVMAAGGETLEAWADRELADARRAHREWLADVMSGGRTSPVGRPTGAVTAIAAPARTPVSGPGPGPDPGPGPARLRPRRRTALVLTALALLLATAIGVYVLATRDDPRAVVTADAATLADAVAPPDAAAPATIDAAPIIPTPSVADAAPARDARARDAAAPRPDARPPSPPDAAPAVAGTAYFTAIARPFCLIRIDGKDYGTTPKVDKPIDAGRHHFVLTDPESGQIVKERTVTLKPGDRFTISR